MRFAVFLAIALAVWLVQHTYVGWRLWPLPAIASAVGHRAMVAVLVAGFLSYPLGRILYAAGWHGTGRALEYAGAVWMGTLFLLFASLLFVDVVTLGGFVLRPWVGALRTAAVALSVVAAAIGLISARLGPRVVRLEVPMATLPQAADGLTIAHLSDVHLGTILGPSFLERLIGRTRALEPDLVGSIAARDLQLVTSGEIPFDATWLTSTPLLDLPVAAAALADDLRAGRREWSLLVDVDGTVDRLISAVDQVRGR